MASTWPSFSRKSHWNVIGSCDKWYKDTSALKDLSSYASTKAVVMSEINGPMDKLFFLQDGSLCPRYFCPHDHEPDRPLACWELLALFSSGFCGDRLITFGLTNLWWVLGNDTSLNSWKDWPRSPSLSFFIVWSCLNLGNARQLVYYLAEQIRPGLDILLKHPEAFLNPTSLGNRSCSGLEMWYPICVHHCPQGETVICPKNLNHEPTTTAKPFYQSIQDGQNGGLLLGRNAFHIALLM